MKNAFFLFAIAALTLTVGCARTEPEMPKLKMVMGIPDGTVEYPTIPTKNLSLKMISAPTLYAGEEGELIFALANKGRRQISIPEWYAYEQDNLSVFIQPWLPGMTEPDPERWFDLSEELKKPVMHYPLTLMPDNQVMITKKMDFVKKLTISKGMTRRYFVKAGINLNSLPLESDVYALQILPRSVAGERK